MNACCGKFVIGVDAWKISVRRSRWGVFIFTSKEYFNVFYNCNDNNNNTNDNNNDKNNNNTNNNNDNNNNNDSDNNNNNDNNNNDNNNNNVIDNNNIHDGITNKIDTYHIEKSLLITNTTLFK